MLEAARLDAQSYGGEREIPLDRVVGSAYEGRTHDFDPAFLPTSARLRQRWQRVYRAMVEGPEIPPIDVYDLEGSYYVIDGHHRVSVARSLDRPTINARVTEVRTRAPLGPEVDRGELLRAAEYAGFLEATGLDRVRPEARLSVSRLGRYDEMLAHILGHRYFMGLDRRAEPSVQEAAADWYDSVYLPIVAVIRRHNVLERMRGWTETDLYVELTRRWLSMSKSGQDAGPHEAVHALLKDHPPGWWWRRRPRRID